MRINRFLIGMHEISFVGSPSVARWNPFAHSSIAFQLRHERARFTAPSQVSDVGSIPIARSITHDDSIVLTPLNQLNTATKLGGFGPMMVPTE